MIVQGVDIAAGCGLPFSVDQVRHFCRLHVLPSHQCVCTCGTPGPVRCTLTAFNMEETVTAYLARRSA